MDHDTPLAAFNEYVGIKVHFNTWKFIWTPRERLSQAALSKRRDRSRFESFVKLIPKESDRVELLVSSFITCRTAWIGDILEGHYDDFHNLRMRRRRSLDYTFRTDCERIHDHITANGLDGIVPLLRMGTQSQPRILTEVFEGGISDETLAILDAFFNYTKQESNNMLWNERRLMIAKYKYVMNLKDYTQKFKHHINSLLAVSA